MTIKSWIPWDGEPIDALKDLLNSDAVALSELKVLSLPDGLLPGAYVGEEFEWEAWKRLLGTCEELGIEVRVGERGKEVAKEAGAVL